MAIANYFYNQTTRKYVAIFGTLFNQLTIQRVNGQGTTFQTAIVPLSYAPFQKILARVEQDANLNRQSAITLPRMSFEITSMQYDGERRIAVRHKIPKSLRESDSSLNYVYAGAPYNLEFSLYIMAKYQEDATKIVEQIIPFFQPDFTVSAKIIENLPPLDVPIILNSVVNEELYEGDFTERRTVMYTLNFTLKGMFYGPERTKKVIKFIDTQYATNISDDSPFEESTETFVVDLANSAIGWSDVEYTDDWAAKTIYPGSGLYGNTAPVELDIFTGNTSVDLDSGNTSIDLSSGGIAIDDLD
jgi:hypothetical protein